jgi:hypothetical protein
VSTTEGMLRTTPRVLNSAALGDDAIASAAAGHV